MARKTLTDRLLKTLKTDAADSIVPGLAVRVGAAGQKTFVLVGRFPGRTNPTRRAIGAYPAISLEQARATARDWIALTQRGLDPAVQVAIEREANRVRQSNTFRAVAESFLEKHAASRRTATAIGRLVRGKLISRWRDRPIDTIGKRDVIDMIEDIQEKSGAAMARQSLTYARRLFGWAAARDFVPVNPCAAVVTADFLPPKVSRDRVLTDPELALVLKATAADGVGYPTAPFTRFVLLTACRRGEAAGAVWAEFDVAQGTWLLPAARVKNASEHALPTGYDLQTEDDACARASVECAPARGPGRRVECSRRRGVLADWLRARAWIGDAHRRGRRAVAGTVSPGGRRRVRTQRRLVSLALADRDRRCDQQAPGADGVTRTGDTRIRLRACCASRATVLARCHGDARWLCRRPRTAARSGERSRAAGRMCGARRRAERLRSAAWYRAG